MRVEKEALNETVHGDVRTLGSFIELYCGSKHDGRTREMVSAGGRVGLYCNDLSLRLCRECASLFLYAASKRIICHFDPKPACKKCPAHCYTTSHRARIREVMRYSGMRMILGGRLGLLKKYFF
jgi:hypothetical protein